MAVSLIQRQRDVLRGLIRLAADRGRAERETASGFASRNEAADAGFRETKQKQTAEYDAEQAKISGEYDKVRQGNAARYDAEQKSADKEFSLTRNKVKEDYTAGVEKG